MTKIWLVLLITIIVPFVSAAEKKTLGATSCRAPVNQYGDVCYSDTSSVPQQPGATLRYDITVRGKLEICCKVYTCSRYFCSMKYIGCGRQTWSSSNLPWEKDSIETPRMQCKASEDRWTIHYSYKTTH
ncbi:uncharacterized protein LOC123562607 [Mercenaria mercenaria]|uniref:uncharacterized protein LOC123562607 n=1 Tax=Mercenaria mercenaria TaxID=6596 RepID=UPI00234EAC97|nr:uncharacterized protein LOC123562607 [Mercenaria mercenaria]